MQRPALPGSALRPGSYGLGRAVVTAADMTARTKPALVDTLLAQLEREVVDLESQPISQWDLDHLGLLKADIRKLLGLQGH